MPGKIERLLVTTDTQAQLVHVLKVILTFTSVKAFSSRAKICSPEIFEIIHEEPELVFYWSTVNGAKPFPGGVEMTGEDAETLARWIYHWLDHDVDWSKLPEPDIDGMCRRGWTVKASDDDFGYTVCSVAPAWVEYHK